MKGPGPGTSRLRQPRRRATLLVLSLLTIAPPAAAQTLSSGILTARFGASGLTSLAATGIEHPFEFLRDDWSLTIDGTRHDRTTLGMPQRVTEPNRVGYVYVAGRYRISIVYELMPGWTFLSKHVAVTASGPASFRIDEVVLFGGETKDAMTSDFVPEPARKNLGLGSYGIALRFSDNRGLFALAQNPFLSVAREGNAFSLSYRPEMTWTVSRGPFVSDRGILAPSRLTGQVEPARMLPEWKLGPPEALPGLDRSEILAFTGAVRQLMVYRPREPINIFVGWCVNDYQIDIATEAGRAEYKRVIDRAAEMGARHVLFAPTNSDLAKREDSTDDWSWENLLWLGLGQKIRRGEWNPATDAVPVSVQEMLDYAKSKQVSLVAYVYPVLAFSQNPAWLTTRRDAKPGAKQYASLASPALQDWLIDTLVAFREKTGVSGYAFDHTFLNFAGASSYAQWWGWRHVMETLRLRMPDIVIDGRQAYHLYGPWSWLAGSYPHPMFNDEQPESFAPFPDLSFDRVSAARERYTAYRYRNHEFAPGELVPGFITHQTSRSDDSGDMPQTKTDRGVMLTPFRVRDWDYLGWRYSLLSSIAVGAWNNVINMIPARDPEEFRHFSADDLAFFRGWLEWARLNRQLLRTTRTILGQPALGKMDGTASIQDNHGYVFLFNPNARRMGVTLALNESIGLESRRALFFHIEELYPRRGRRIGKPTEGLWSYGDTVTMLLDGHSAAVLEIQELTAPAPGPMVLNLPASVVLVGDTLRITRASGEMGTTERVQVLVRESRQVKRLLVNGREVPIASRGDNLIEADVSFEGTWLPRDPQIGAFIPEFTGGTYVASFTVPKRVFDQLAARRASWPIPWTAEDLKTPWLAPERLLLYVQIAEPDDKWEATLRIDGMPVALEKAYSAVRAVPSTFVGFYADVSSLTPDTEHKLELVLPPLRPGQFQGVFLQNIEPEYTEKLR